MMNILTKIFSGRTLRFFASLRMTSMLVLSFLFFLSLTFATPKPGYTIHFNGIHTVNQAKQLVTLANKAGAEVINVVPPSHIWDDADSKAMLDAIFEEARNLDIQIVLTRIDANYANGKNYLYDTVLKGIGTIYPTIGNDSYAQWMREETEYYAKEYGNEPNLIGFNVGIYSDPFLSKLGGLLEWDKKTKRYEIAQKSAVTRKYWQAWLIQKLGTIERVNQEYKTSFSNVTEIPLPVNEEDKQFGQANRAYVDFVSSLNEWILTNYTTDQAVWHQYSSLPFIFQIDGRTSDVLANGRGAYAALDITKWFSVADAMGISLYADSGQDDLGLDAMQGTLNLCGFATEFGKPLFVLESGTKGPAGEPPKYMSDVLFHIALPYQPVTYIYEYFQESHSMMIHDQRYMLTLKGKPIEPSYSLVKRSFAALTTQSPIRLTPYLYIVSSPKTIRDDGLAGRFYAMTESAASFTPIRRVNYEDMAFISPKSFVLLAPSWTTPLSDDFQRDFMKLAKARDWQVMLDDNNYPLIKQNLKSEIHGATIDLREFLKDSQTVTAGLGFGKAIVEFYEKQFKSMPNGLTPDLGTMVVPCTNGLFITLNYTVQNKLTLDLSPWKLKPTDNFFITLNRRDGEPTPLVIASNILPKTAKYAIRIDTKNPQTGKRILLKYHSAKEAIEFSAEDLREYRLSFQSTIRKK